MFRSLLRLINLKVLLHSVHLYTDLYKISKNKFKEINMSPLTNNI